MFGMKMTDKQRWIFASGLRSVRFAGLAAMALLACGISGAQEKAPPKGPPAPKAFLIQVPLPIAGNVDGQVKSRILQILKSL